MRVFRPNKQKQSHPVGGKGFSKASLPTSLPSSHPKVRKLKGDLSFIRCEKLVMESGKIVYVYYPDCTMKNLMERIAFEDQVK